MPVDGQGTSAHLPCENTPFQGHLSAQVTPREASLEGALRDEAQLFVGVEAGLPAFLDPVVDVGQQPLDVHSLGLDLEAHAPPRAQCPRGTGTPGAV